LLLESDHLSLRSFHKTVSRRFDQLFGHVMHPVIVPEPLYPNDGTRERFVTKLGFGDAVARNPANSAGLLSAHGLQFREPKGCKQATKLSEPTSRTDIRFGVKTRSSGQDYSASGLRPSADIPSSPRRLKYGLCFARLHIERETRPGKHADDGGLHLIVTSATSPPPRTSHRVSAPTCLVGEVSSMPGWPTWVCRQPAWEHEAARGTFVIGRTVAHRPTASLRRSMQK
jgi:hypothetical protein